MDINACMIYSRTLPAHNGIYEALPESLAPEIKDYLRGQGLHQLYCHQRKMYEEAINGKNVVITTSTASGKTLSFLLPVLQRILQDPTARAIFIYPTKALASDQYRALIPILEHFGANKICAGVYDGDTPSVERSRIRREANIILTNPEILNVAFLPNHSKFGFDFIFSNLQYIVIDELHTYRGAFGSHLANVFRRLHRICNYYKSKPQFLCSSATIANPVELAEEICSVPFVQVSKDGAPAAERTYILVQPPKLMGKDHKYYGQVQATAVAANMIPALIENGNSFLTFTKSRRNVEVILKEARDQLMTESYFGNTLQNQISGYRGGYTPKERKEIEQKMITGAIRGLVSTNALELGIDIGKIDTTVLVGFPGTRASFWQQTGRAGRSGMKSTNYMILEQLPFDQYIAINPEWLFENQSESAVIDKNNLLIQLAHIRAAAAELPLSLDDISLFPDLGETIPVLIHAGEVTNQNGRFAWNGDSFPAGEYSLRNIDQARYKLINRDSSQMITEMDEAQAFREIHPGAVYMHDGVQYEVVSLDLETKTALAIPFQGNFYTVPNGETNIKIIHMAKNRDYKKTKIFFGDVNVKETIFMYKKLQFHTHQNMGFEQLRQPLEKQYDTESIWLKMPDEVVRVYRGLFKEEGNGHIIRNNHFEGLSYAIKNAALMLTMTETEDLGTSMSNNLLTFLEAFDQDVYMFLYDKYIGGLGYSEKIYDFMERIIEQAITMVSHCTCEDGCVACIGDYQLDKHVVLWGLQSMLQELAAPKDIKVAERAPVIFQKKAFRFQDLTTNWQAFCEEIQKNGEQFSSFCKTITEVKVQGNVLQLMVDKPFYKEWLMQKENYQNILTLISYYTDAPASLTITVQAKHRDEQAIDTRNKIEKRYQNLTEDA